MDVQKDFLASCNLDGGDFKKVLSGLDETNLPFAVAVFKDIVLRIVWTRKPVFQVD